MKTPTNAPPVGIADDFLEQLFSMPASFGCDSGTAAMPLWLGSGLPSASSTAGDGGFPLGLNLDEKRGVFAISEEGEGSENRFLGEADVKADTEGESLAHLPTSMSLTFGHVQSHQIRPNNPPRALHDQAAEQEGHQPPTPRPKVRTRLGQATDPHSIAEQLNGDANDSRGTKQQMWEKWSNDGTELKGAKLMQFLQSKALCIMRISLATTIVYSQNESSESCALKPPEPDAPL